MNEDGTKSANFPSAYVDVTMAKVNNGLDGFEIAADDIPSYSTTITSSIYNQLTSRPKKITDFKNGSPSVSIGQKVSFGENIGYSSTGCSMGYWPPGPVCPSAKKDKSSFMLTPAPETGSGCYSGSGSIGTLVNGVALFNGGDTNSYNKKDVWHSTAMSHEVYDLDICLGHAAMGQYHHHSYSPCLGSALNDDGSDHSPIYGWLNDGFPIYGPYQSFGVLARTCWKKRDYSSTSEGKWGCSDGIRSCVLKDLTDPSKGTTALDAASYGPDPVTGTVETLSKNTITAEVGIYFEDYFFDKDCYEKSLSLVAKGQRNQTRFLDVHNGHTHGGLGYHYHFTLDEQMQPEFPYAMGLTYYGCLKSGQCIDSLDSALSGPGGGGGPGGSGSGGGSGPPGGKSGPPGGKSGPPSGGGGSSSGGSPSTSSGISKCGVSTAVEPKKSKCMANGRTTLKISAKQVLVGVKPSSLSSPTSPGRLAFEGAIMTVLEDINPRQVSITSVTSARRSLLEEMLLVTSSTAVSYTITGILQASGYSSATALSDKISSDLSSTTTLSTLASLLTSANSTVFSSVTVQAASVNTATVTSDYSEAPTPQPVFSPSSSNSNFALGLGLGLGLAVAFIVAFTSYYFFVHKKVRGYSLCGGPTSRPVGPMSSAHAEITRPMASARPIDDYDIEFTGIQDKVPAPSAPRAKEPRGHL